MEHTRDYELTIWNAEDRIMREDFNEDNTKTENALANLTAAQNQMAQVLAGCGNCQVYTTTYTGNGSTAGKSITFPAKPIIVMISDSSGKNRNIFWQGMPFYALLTQTTYPATLTWNGNTVTLTDGENTKSAEKIFNKSGSTYYLAALLQMDS